MSSIDTEFCREMLKDMMKDVRYVVDAEIVKEMGCYNYGDGCIEVQIPSKKFYWYGQAANNADARYQAWWEYLNTNHPEFVAYLNTPKGATTS